MAGDLMTAAMDVSALSLLLCLVFLLVFSTVPAVRDPLTASVEITTGIQPVIKSSFLLSSWEFLLTIAMDCISSTVQSTVVHCTVDIVLQSIFLYFSSSVM